MTWNHRVVRFRAGQEDEYLEICEVFYDADDPKKPYAHTQGVAVHGQSIDELRVDLDRMQRCLDLPILDQMGPEDDD